MDLIKNLNGKLKEKGKDIFTDTSHDGEIKRLGIPIYLSGILLAFIGANRVFNFKPDLIAMIDPICYSYFLTIVNIAFDILLFVFIVSFCICIITFIISFILELVSNKVPILERFVFFLRDCSKGADYRGDNTYTWLFCFLLLMLATQPDKIITDTEQILLFFRPIKYLAYLSIIPAITYTFTNILSLLGRFLSEPMKHYINNKMSGIGK